MVVVCVCGHGLQIRAIGVYVMAQSRETLRSWGLCVAGRLCVAGHETPPIANVLL